MNTENPTPQLGTFLAETSAAYHATEAVSASKLRVFQREPGGAALYHRSFVKKCIERKTTDAMLLGQAVHCLVLEGWQKYAAQFAVAPKCDKRTTIGKAAFAEFSLRLAGKTILDHDDAELLLALKTAVDGHPIAAQLLSAGQPETTFRAKAGGKDVAQLPPLQCRPDWINREGHPLSNGRPYVLDLKSTESLESWQRSFEDYAYHRQAAFYMAILDLLGITLFDFYFIAVEKTEPYGVLVQRLSDDALKQGQDEVAAMLVRLNACYRDNVWPNASTELGEINLSAAYLRRQQQRG